MKKDLTQLVLDYAAGAKNPPEAGAVKKKLLRDSRTGKAESAIVLQLGINAGRVLGTVEASTHDEAYQHFQEAMAAPAICEALGELKIENGSGHFVPLPLHGDMLGMAGQALQNYLAPFLKEAWEYAYMKGRMEEAAEWNRVPF